MNRFLWLLSVVCLILLVCLPLQAAQGGIEPARLLAKTKTPTPSPTAIPVSVLSPQAGQAVQGAVPVTVHTITEGFLASELYFSYSGDQTNTWFLITQHNAAMSGEVLATWDTSTISDGDYILRLVVTRQDLEPVIALVEPLRVRNYSPIETDTPTPSATIQPGDLPTLTPTPEPTHTPVPPTPTPLPTNPVILSNDQLGMSAGWGIAGAFVIFLLLGLYLSGRQALRSKEK